MSTAFVKIDAIKEAFEISPVWKQNWGSVDTLLKTYMFKELVFTKNIGGKNYKIQEEKWSKYTTKLEFAILGLLWCSGTQE